MSKVNPALSFPILLFESDGYYQRVDQPDDLPGLYDNEYWDEVVAAFGSQFKPVGFTILNDSLIGDVQAESDTSRFEWWARRALIRSSRRSKPGVARARPPEQKEILALDAVSLWDELLART